MPGQFLHFTSNALKALRSTLSEAEQDRMFKPVHRPGLEYQIMVLENTVTTDARGREAAGFDRNVINANQVIPGNDQIRLLPIRKLPEGSSNGQVS